jgi:alpha-mannosidase
MSGTRVTLSALALLLVSGSAAAAGPDLTRQPTLYVVGYAHLDTQWRWEYPQTIGEYLPRTLQENFALFDKYPHYVFNFSGANRYRMIQEYDPAGFEELKRWVAAGRWFPAGSSMEEADVNSPSAESILRQVLYGNGFFRRELGRASSEFMLPDCFGFPASLPSLLAHAGLKGFSTQKLSWHSAAPVGGPDSAEQTPAGIPFNVGFWEGPDGRGVIAALNPGTYGSNILTDLTKSVPGPRGTPEELAEWPVSDWPARLALDGKASGLYADYRYYGTGDMGGAPSEFSVNLLEAILGKGQARLPQLPADLDQEEDARKPLGPEVRVGDGPVRVVSATAEQMFEDLVQSGGTGRLPRYKGDLELTNHSAGSLTSQAAHKRWNRKNERLAASAEEASVAAAWLGRPYPLERLNRAWALVMGGQFHDIMAGTATPKAYEYSWNDDVLAMNQFSEVLQSAVEGIAPALDTRARGTAVVVFNPLGVEREDPVEATLVFPHGPPPAVRVTGPDGKEVPSQLQEGGAAGETRVLFLAKVPSIGFAVYDIQASTSPGASAELIVDERTLENARYRVRLDEAGDVASLFDKVLGRELLAGPARLAFVTEKPYDWPAWNMDWADQQRPPRAYVGGPARFRVVESGPARVAVEVEREAEGSRFVQTLRLAAGDAGGRVELADAIDWKTGAAALKATFPLSAANPEATYAWGVGTVRRGNDVEKQFEVASHQWFDLTDQSGAWGTSVLSDCQTGSDKPDDRTLRLTLLYTPGLGGGNAALYSDQASQDWGHHEIRYGLASHAGDWRAGDTDWQAERLSVPLIAFESGKHEGKLGKAFSLLRVGSDHVRVMALKRAEAGGEVIVRLVETRGEPAADVRLSFAAPLEAAREVDGQERPLGAATVTAGALATSFTPNQLLSFAVKLARAPHPVAAPKWQPVGLPYDLAAASTDGSSSQGGFAADGRALPAELLPATLDYRGIRFKLAPAASGRPNAVVARGQALPLPAGRFNRLYVLAASAEGDRRATFRVGGRPVELTVQD